MSATSTRRRARPGKQLIAHDRGLGARMVAGTDEAGRGALAGPIVAAAVVLDTERLVGPEAAYLGRLDDSKRLTPDLRSELYRQVMRIAAGVTVRAVSAGRIDRHGIQRANHGAMVAALRALQPAPEIMLVDGYALQELPDARQLVKGDQTSAAVAAAAIVAKVSRDRMMAHIGASTSGPWPLAESKGYGTEAHIESIRVHGASIHHRRTFLTRILDAEG